MKKFRLILSFAFILMSYLAISQISGINSNNEGIIKNEGFFNFFYNQSTDQISLEIDKLDFEFLYINGISAGLGSNDIGIDRGQVGGSKVVKFIKAGNKILLIEPNYNFRANSDNPDEVLAVEDAFAKSVLWSFKITKVETGRFIVDATDFFMRDALNVANKLKRSNAGNFSVDKSRSAFHLDRTKNFPLNTEFDVLLTFVGTPTGRGLSQVVPTTENISIRQHHSFVQLPDDNYKPRKFDPRSGYFRRSYMDYASPLSESIEKKFIVRHRLEKKNPNAKISEAIEPIVYYLDRGAPEPVRTALLTGVSWWNQAFEAIGYKDAFRVEMLPEGADPLDVRYNLIQWVHRSTRGWSYGNAVTDPRTGEIIKGHVSLGSLRVRQDYLIAIGLMAPYKNGDEIPKDVEEMALARIRQLGAHEVGHTLGLTHNYASSTEGRTSVMDYPHPLVEIKNGKLSLENAYDNKIGDFDKVSIAYGYQDFPDGVNEEAALNEIIQKSLKDGLSFIADQDARPDGAHPHTHLWDNGKVSYQELDRMMQVRKIALNNFGEQNIKTGMPYASLEEVLVPVYFFHRYQIEATSKMLGGLDYRYALRGDGQFITKEVPGEEQLKALDVLIKTIQPESLMIPERLLKLLAPRVMGDRRSNETIKIRTNPVFDALGAAESLADMTIGFILEPTRVGRMVEFNARNKNQPGLETLIEQLLNTSWKGKRENGYTEAIQKTTDLVLLRNLFKLATNQNASELVRSKVFFQLNELKKYLEIKYNESNMSDLKAHYWYAMNEIERFLDDPKEYKMPETLSPPAGSPIGTMNVFNDVYLR